MAEAEAVLRFRTVGAETTQRALSGITTAARQVSETVKRFNREGAADAERSSTQETRARQTALQAAQRFTASQLDFVRTLARAMEAEGVTSARGWQRAWERAARDSRRALEESGPAGGGGGGRGGTLGGVVSAGIAIAGGAAALVGRAQAVAGVRSIDERARGAIDFQRILVALSASTGIPEGDVSASLLRATAGTGRLPADVAGAVSDASDRFGPEVTAGILDQIEALGDVSIGANATLEETITLVGQLAAAFDVGREGIRELIGGVASLSSSGRVPIGALAGMGEELTLLGRATRRRGVGGALEAVGAVETLGEGLAIGEISPALRSLVDRLRVTRRNGRVAGVRVWEAGGGLDPGLRPLADLFEDLGTTRRRVTSPGGDSEGSGRLRNAIEAIRGNPSDLRHRLDSLDAEAGVDRFRELADRFRATPEGRFVSIGASAESATIADVDRILSELQATTAATTELESQFPLLSAALGTLTSTIQSLFPLLGGYLGGRLALGGGAAAAAGGGAGTAGIGGGLLAGRLVPALGGAATVLFADEGGAGASSPDALAAGVRAAEAERRERRERILARAMEPAVPTYMPGTTPAPTSLTSTVLVGGLGPVTVRLDPGTIADLAAATGGGPPTPAGSGRLTETPTPAGRRGP